MERRKFTEEFRKEAVRKLELRGNRTVKDVAESLGVRPRQLFAWRRKYEEAASAARAERGESAEEEIKRLRRENRELREEREILKKATAFFARQKGH